MWVTPIAVSDSKICLQKLKWPTLTTVTCAHYILILSYTKVARYYIYYYLFLHSLYLFVLRSTSQPLSMECIQSSNNFLCLFCHFEFVTCHFGKFLYSSKPLLARWSGQEQRHIKRQLSEILLFDNFQVEHFKLQFIPILCACIPTRVKMLCTKSKTTRMALLHHMVKTQQFCNNSAV